MHDVRRKEKKMIDRATIDRIMDATNIVDVVSDFVTLKKRGANYIGLCPFHDDTHPSFSVSPSRGICHCFTCGKGGNAVNFLMQLENLSYPDALRWLARKYNIEIREKELTAEEKKQETERESMFLVNEWALKYFENILHNDPDGKAIGLQYFRSRGFRDDTIAKFHLGYSLMDRRAMSTAALKEGYKKEFLIKTGLCYQRDNGELVDRFAGRVIFPWFSLSGKVVGFNGRVLDSRTHGVSQKYVNSPDSEIYHKGEELFGLNQAKQSIRKADSVILVEGQADVISMSQSSVENVVAGSGTALTQQQIRKLHRFTDNITLIYDGDDAGVNAALKNSDLIHAEGMNVKVLFLPDGQDPDDFSKSHTPEELRKFIDDNSTDSILFRIEHTLKGVTDPIKRSTAINAVVQSIAIVRDPILRDTYVRECSQRTGVPEETLIQQMNRVIRHNIDERRKQKEREEARENFQQQQQVSQQDATATTAAASSPTPQPATFTRATAEEQTSKVEDLLMEAIIRYGNKIIFHNVENETTGEKTNLNVAQYVAYDLGLDGLSFSSPTYNKILQEAVEQSGNPDFEPVTYFSHHPNINIATIASRMSVDKFQLSDSLKINYDEKDIRDGVLHMILDFRLNYVETHLEEIRKRLMQTKDNEKMMQLMSEFQKMQQIRNILAQKVGSNIVL